MHFIFKFYFSTENIIWDENIVPNEYYSGEGCLSLPKLNLQFLTLHDYLLRNCNLFRLESTFEIRQDIEDAVSRMLPWKDEEGEVMFAGWARMVWFSFEMQYCLNFHPIFHDVYSFHSGSSNLIICRC